ncbi:MADS box transcription factor [Rhizopogon vesiculosus]|uniref:MADS box transcription factor n=1 Tax=Rhizopogon vesiculosus TaxID=180088 RepID=A0A1J8PJX0_9AGAM|nr:MADS box transcription factor [Rhizopogon vesiculosus]
MIMDNDILRAWLLIHELSDQLSHNQKMSNALHLQADAIKDQAIHASSGFVLRRYNTDISKENFDSELERMNAQFIIENQTLLYENKQFSVLLREYETTMETIMSKFRNHALAAQQHELTLTRHYEGLLHACDAQNQYADLTSETKSAVSLQRLARSLRALHRSMSGEESEVNDDRGEDSPVDVHALIQTLDQQADSEMRDDWALEREVEISRLEKENEELRKMLGIDSASLSEKGITIEPEESARYSRSLTVGSRKRSGSSSSGSHMSPWGFDVDISRERESNPWSGWESQPQSQPQPPPPPPPQRQQGQQRLQQQQQQHPPLLSSNMRIQEPIYSNQLPYAKTMRRPANLFSPNPGPAPPVGSSVGWPQSTPSKPDRWIQT